MKTTKCAIILVIGLIAASALAQSSAGSREAFLRQQAYNEMQKVSGQVDVLQSNLNDLATRVSKLEGDGSSKSEIESLKSEIAALKASNAELRRSINSMHDEIVKELSVKIASLMKQNAAPAPSAAKPAKQQTSATTSYDGPHREYIVRQDDSLWLISQAFKTTVPKIKEMNGLKDNNIRPGQKLILPL